MEIREGCGIARDRLDFCHSHAEDSMTAIPSLKKAMAQAAAEGTGFEYLPAQPVFRGDR
jgi:hypothetical protein